MSIIGVDLGGTKVKAGLFSQQLELISSVEYPLDKYAIMPQLKRLVQELTDESAEPIMAVGVGTAGRVKAGKITYATPNLPNWTGTDVQGELEQHFHLPVMVDNDANTAAIAEGSMGAAQGYSNYACITIGTGIGAGIVVNGYIQSGVAGGAGEVGHMILVPNGVRCNCGRKGCYEQYASGTALQRMMHSHQEELQAITTPQQLFIAASNGHATAKYIVHEFVHYLAIGMINIQNVLELECIVIGGGIIHSGAYWWPPLMRILQDEYAVKCEVKQAILKNDAGMIGAAILAKERSHESCYF